MTLFAPHVPLQNLPSYHHLLTIIRNRHPELVSGSMGYRKSEMLKKFQHYSDIAKLSIFDYGIRRRERLLWPLKRIEFKLEK